MGEHAIETEVIEINDSNIESSSAIIVWFYEASDPLSVLATVFQDPEMMAIKEALQGSLDEGEKVYLLGTFPQSIDIYSIQSK